MTDLLELRQQIAEISKSKLLAQRLKQG